MPTKNVLDYYGIQYILIPVDEDNKSISASVGREFNVLMGMKEYESYLFCGFRNTGYLVTVDPEEHTVTVNTGRTDMPWGLAVELAKMSVPQATDVQFRDNRIGYSETGDPEIVIIEYSFDYKEEV